MVGRASRAWHSDGVDVSVGGDGPLQADEHDVVGVRGVDAGRALQAEDAAEQVARVTAAAVAPVLWGKKEGREAVLYIQSKHQHFRGPFRGFHLTAELPDHSLRMWRLKRGLG